jgi:hypothetical protein
VKDKYFIRAIFIAVFIIIRALPLHALGVGVYTTGSAGVMYLSGITANYCVGTGFVLDTAVASNDLFNYRLNAGYDNVIDSGSPFFGGWSTHRITLSNTFGIGLIRNKYIRLWAGPLVEFGCHLKKANKRTYGSFNTDAIIISDYSTNIAMISLAFGAVVGLNINPGDLFTISFEVGLSTSLGLGKYREAKNMIFIPSSPTGAFVYPSSNAYDRAFGKIEGISRLSFIFRISDTYSSGAI